MKAVGSQTPCTSTIAFSATAGPFGTPNIWQVGPQISGQISEVFKTISAPDTKATTGKGIIYLSGKFRLLGARAEASGNTICVCYHNAVNLVPKRLPQSQH